MADRHPFEILEEVAAAVSPNLRKHIIVIGSLAVGYHFFGRDRRRGVRTKDVDCLLFPGVAAVEYGSAIALQLLADGWRPREDADHGKPGTVATPDANLPAVRLYPPGDATWFIELLSVPDADAGSGRTWKRLALPQGHFGLPSFRFLSIAAFHPAETEFGMFCARPELMALSNLLEHPAIGPERMRALTADRAIKRSNKDLGRVLAIAWLSSTTSDLAWHREWMEALKNCFPAGWKELARGAGTGLASLLESEEDLEEALHTCRNGVLSSESVTLEGLRISGQRLMKDAIEPLKILASDAP